MTERIHARARNFLKDYFSDEELTDFCFDYFRQVYEDFSQGMPKSQKVRMVVDVSQRSGRFDELLAALERERPKSYADHFAEQPHLIAPESQTPKAAKRNPRQIFISHASQDAEFAQKLASDLRAQGWQTWIAPDNIQPGEKWVEAINRGLIECGIFALVVSENALNSRWVESETNAAISLEHRGEMRFVPLALEPVNTPPLWGNYQQISFYDDYDRGLEQLLRHFEGGRQSAGRVTTAVVEPVAKSGSMPVIEVVPEPEKASDEQPDSFVHPITGKEMVRIPAGEFLYSDDNKRFYLDEFWIDKTPVTNMEYKRFLDINIRYDVPQMINSKVESQDEANVMEVIGRVVNSVLIDSLKWTLFTRYAMEKRKEERKYQWNKQDRVYPKGMANHPVVLVSWHDAQAYVAWAKAELPSEHQWEKAARGFDGRIYPWGNEWLQDHCNAKESGIGGTMPVGYYSPKGDSLFGCSDMSGNVREWTSSLWEPESKRYVLRGGSWSGTSIHVQTNYRSNGSPDAHLSNVGFRTIMHHPPSKINE